MADKKDARNRKLRRAMDRQESTCRGCRKNRRDLTDTGTVEAGHHTHGRRPQAHDHATGTGFVENDPSATKAVRRRMADMPWLLKGEVPPLLDDPRRQVQP